MWCATGILIALLCPRTVHAAKRVVVSPFVGDRGGNIADQVRGLVAEEYRVIGADTYERASTRLSRRARGGDLARAVADDLFLDAVVEGRVRIRELRVTLHVAATGELYATITVPLQRRALGERSQRRLRRQLLHAIENMPGHEATGRPAPRSRRSTRHTVDYEYGDNDVDRLEDEESDFDDEYERDEEDESDEVSATSRRETGLIAAWRTRGKSEKPDWLSLYVGSALLGRSMTFAVHPQLQESLAPSPYYLTGAVGVGLSGEAFPFALRNRRSFLDNITVTFGLERSLAIQTEAAFSQAESQSVESTMTHFQLGLGYRMAFGKPGASPSITFFTRTAGLDFANTPSGQGQGAMDLPDTGYRTVSLGGRLAIPFWSGRANLVGQGAYLHVLSVGDLASAENYGTGSSTGAEAEAALEISLFARRKVLARLGYRFTRFAHKFEGDGHKADRDDINDQDVFGAIDIYSSLFVSAGMRF